MPAADPELLAKARRRTPADPAARACWDPIVLGIVAGWLTTDVVRGLVDELAAGRDVKLRRLRLKHADDGLRVSFDGNGASCPPAAMRAELTRLVAEPPADPARLVATPIAWDHSGDAELPYRARVDGRNLTVRVNDFPAEPLYTLIADGADLADLEDWPAGWTSPPTPQRVLDLVSDSPERRSAARAVGIGRLRIWSEEICGFRSGDPTVVARALGIDGLVVTKTAGSAAVEPPPPGTTSLRLSSRAGGLGSLTVTFATGAPTRADFDTYFGHGMRLPRVHWDRPHRLAYHVERPGEPATGTVFPSFADEPADATAATEVTLRRDPR